MPTVQLQNQVRIWFSTPQDQKNEPTPFGGELNLQRMRSFLQTNPEIKLTIVTNIMELYRKGDFRQIHAIKQFVDTYKDRISLMDIEHIHISQLSCKDYQTQIKLLELAKRELSDPHGNVAAASDIIRTLSPLLAMGLYTDFDYNFSGPCPLEVDLPQGILLNSFPTSMNENGELNIGMNNDFLLTAETESQFMLAYRAQILDNYLELDRFSERAIKKQSLSANDYATFLKTQIMDVSGPRVLNSIAKRYFFGQLQSCHESSVRNTCLEARTGMLDGSWTESGKARLKRLNLFVRTLLDEKIISKTDYLTHEIIYEHLITNLQNPKIHKLFKEEFMTSDNLRFYIQRTKPLDLFKKFVEEMQTSLIETKSSVSKNLS